jgi:hypothetical protein
MPRFARTAAVTAVLIVLVPSVWLNAQREPTADEVVVAALRARAEKGDAPAQFNLAEMYVVGLRVLQDYAEALRGVGARLDAGT